MNSMEEEKQEEVVSKEEKKPKVKNISIGIAGSVLLPLLVGGSLAISWARDPDRPKKSFVYEATDDGKIEAKGRVKYDEVAGWYLVEKELTNGSSRLFIVDNKDTVFGSLGCYDIQTDKSLSFSLSSNSVLKYANIAPYLITYDMVYDSYTSEDMNQLLELIAANWEYAIANESDKVMIKLNENE